VLDKHHGVIASLGDCFLLLRLADPDPGEAGRLALKHVGQTRPDRRRSGGMPMPPIGQTVPPHPVAV
jgi:hypothetical protein